MKVDGFFSFNSFQDQSKIIQDNDIWIIIIDPISSEEDSRNY